MKEERNLGTLKMNRVRAPKLSDLAIVLRFGTSDLLTYPPRDQVCPNGIPSSERDVLVLRAQMQRPALIKARPVPVFEIDVLHRLVKIGF